jgi:hypothetical protein
MTTVSKPELSPREKAERSEKIRSGADPNNPDGWLALAEELAGEHDFADVVEAINDWEDVTLGEGRVQAAARKRLRKMPPNLALFALLLELSNLVRSR